MQLQSPTAQRLVARLKHLAHIVEHHCTVDQEVFNNDLIQLNSEVMLYLSLDAQLEGEYFSEHIQRIKDELIRSVETPAFGDCTREIRKATQALRNQPPSEALAPVLAFGSRK